MPESISRGVVGGAGAQGTLGCTNGENLKIGTGEGLAQETLKVAD